MEIKNYIGTGNLEQHCFDLFNADLSREIAELSLTHPELKQELNEIENTIELLVKSLAITPDSGLKARILGALDFAEDEVLDINNLPPTNKYSDYTQWLKAVEHIIPAEPFKDFFTEVIKQDEHITQMLVITKLDVPKEVHDTTAESFFILKGQCACTVGNEVFTLNAGDHLDIPLYVNHNVKILSPYVIAILQHQF